MAGVYGEIDSRTDFFRVLNESSTTSKQLLARNPQDPTIRAIDAQLEAISRWTAAGREPTQSERESLDMGQRAARELSDTGDPAIDAFTQKLHALHNYVEDWPTDEDAATATDDDFFDNGDNDE